MIQKTLEEPPDRADRTNGVRYQFGLDRLIVLVTVCCCIAAGVAYWVRFFANASAHPMGCVIYTLAMPSLVLLAMSLVSRVARRNFR